MQVSIEENNILKISNVSDFWDVY